MTLMSSFDGIFNGSKFANHAFETLFMNGDEDSYESAKTQLKDVLSGFDTYTILMCRIIRQNCQIFQDSD